MKQSFALLKNLFLALSSRCVVALQMLNNRTSKISQLSALPLCSGSKVSHFTFVTVLILLISTKHSPHHFGLMPIRVDFPYPFLLFRIISSTKSNSDYGDRQAVDVIQFPFLSLVCTMTMGWFWLYFLSWKPGCWWLFFVSSHSANSSHNRHANYRPQIIFC